MSSPLKVLEPWNIGAAVTSVVLREMRNAGVISDEAARKAAQRYDELNTAVLTGKVIDLDAEGNGTIVERDAADPEPGVLTIGGEQ